MPRKLNLRQIEAFKAVVELGTVSLAAEALHISQPAASKLLNHLEADTELKLFDRVKGRLAPTAQGMRLYGEIDRIFAGVKQVESAVDVIRREEQGRLFVGVLPALSGFLIQNATTEFIKSHPNVYCSFQVQSSKRIIDDILSRQLDVGLVIAPVDNPFITTEFFLEIPFVCIMSRDHPLARYKVIRPEQLRGVPFISFNSDSYIGREVNRVFENSEVSPNVVLTANTTHAVCQFTAAGLGVSLVHPHTIPGPDNLIVTIPVEPETTSDFLVCYARNARNTILIQDFAKKARSLAARLSADSKKVAA